MATAAKHFASGVGGIWSIYRDNQFIGQYETADFLKHGVGVLSGGKVSKTTGMGVEIETGSVFLCEGVTLTLAAVQPYTCTGTGTIYLYGTITRTAASPTAPTALDTYALVVTQNTTGTAPTDQAIPLAIVVVGGSVISIDNAPAGKYARALPNIGRREITVSGTTTLTAAQYRDGILELIGAAGTVVFPKEAGRRWIVFNSLSGSCNLKTVDGTALELEGGATLLVYCDGVDILAGGPTSAGFSSEVDALREELDELTAKFRVLVRLLVAEVGIGLHPRLEDDYCLAEA